MKFKVYVEKRMYTTGSIEIEATDEDEAVEMVERGIGSGTIQTTDIEWGDIVYEDFSFATTGEATLIKPMNDATKKKIRESINNRDSEFFYQECLHLSKERIKKIKKEEKNEN